MKHNGTTREGWLPSSRLGENENLRVLIEPAGEAVIIHQNPGLSVRILLEGL